MLPFTILYRSANAVVYHAVDPDAVPAAPAQTAPAHIQSSLFFWMFVSVGMAAKSSLRPRACLKD